MQIKPVIKPFHIFVICASLTAARGSSVIFGAVDFLKIDSGGFFNLE